MDTNAVPSPGSSDMHSFAFRRTLRPALFAVALAVVGAGAQAQEPRMFVVPAAAGYGVDECLDGGDECGRMVANAWCNAYGQGVALEFGRYEGESSASNPPW